MKYLEVSGAVRHIYVVRQLSVNSNFPFFITSHNGQIFIYSNKSISVKGRGRGSPLQARLWPRGWVEV